MAHSSESPRKTLDDIRRELDAEYPVAAEAETPVHAAAVQCPSPVARRRELGRRHIMVAALGGVGALLLLLVGYAVVSLGPMRPNALASARETSAPNGAAAKAARESRDARPVPPMVSPTVLTELERELKALRSDLKALADRLERSDSRIGGMESRVQGVESSMRRLAGDAATAAAERTVAAPRRKAESPPPVVAIAPSAAPLTAPESERWIPVRAPSPERATAPQDVRPAVELVMPPEAPTPPPTTTDVAESRPVSADSDVPATLPQKLRAEWRTIKQGFATAGDDFKAVMRDFARKVAGD
jgi:hypothetical protein